MSIVSEVVKKIPREQKDKILDEAQMKIKLFIARGYYGDEERYRGESENKGYKRSRYAQIGLCT